MTDYISVLSKYIQLNYSSLHYIFFFAEIVQDLYPLYLCVFAVKNLKMLKSYVLSKSVKKK